MILRFANEIDIIIFSFSIAHWGPEQNSHPKNESIKEIRMHTENRPKQKQNRKRKI